MKKPLRILIGLVLLTFLGFFLGPPLIHLGYRSVTGPDEKEQNSRAYFQKAADERSLTDAAKIQESQRARLRLYDWFHARGWEIDEGDEELRWNHSWAQLFRYWKG